MRATLFQRVRLQFLQRDEFERRGVGCFKIDRGRAVVIERAFPARDAHAPFVARSESGEAEFRTRRDEIIAIEHGIIQKLLRDFDADGMQADVFRTCSTKTVAVEPSHRAATTTF